MKTVRSFAVLIVLVSICGFAEARSVNSNSATMVVMHNMVATAFQPGLPPPPPRPHLPFFRRHRRPAYRHHYYRHRVYRRHYRRY